MRAQTSASTDHRADGLILRNAAWTYPFPSPLAWPIRRMIAFAPDAGITVRGTARR